MGWLGAVVEHRQEIFDRRSAHGLESLRTVLGHDGASRSIDGSLALIVFGARVGGIGLRAPVIEKERPKCPHFFRIRNLVRQCSVELLRIGGRIAVEHETRHLPRVHRLRHRQHAAGHTGRDHPPDQLDPRFGHAAPSIAWLGRLLLFACLLRYPLVKVVVSYYAAARELAGCESSTFEFEADRVAQAELRSAVATRFPGLADFLSRMRFAINDEFASGSEELRDGDRVDVLPPVAGGAEITRCRIVYETISIDDTRRAVEHPGAGGICTFCGVVRNNAEGKEVLRLDYEAHEGMAEKEMRRALDSVVSEHPGVRLAAVHRVGSLRVGDVAVCVAASAPHRDEAFAACRKAIDRIKESVPVWKKEWGPDGQAHWVNLEG